MRLSRLRLYDFRNYEQLQLELDPGVNLILGENAQGKTNLLEAVSYLSTGRSFRTAKTQELIRFGADFADLNCRRIFAGTGAVRSRRIICGKKTAAALSWRREAEKRGKTAGRSDDRSLLPRRPSGSKGRKPAAEEDSSIPHSASSGRAMQLRSQSITACLTARTAF